MRKPFKIIVIAACVGAWGAGTVLAQQAQDQNPPSTQGQQQAPDQGSTQPQGPIPAYRSPLAGATGGPDDETPTELTPDTSPITGVQNLGLGTPRTHSYWQPHVDISSTIDSNPNETTSTGSNWGTWISLSGGVDVHRASASNDLELNYVGGGTISNNTDASDGVVQELSFSDKYLFRRWNLSIFDNLSYLPESAFGFNGLGAGGLGEGGGGGGIFSPGQTLLTGRGQNLGNTFEAEGDVLLSPRASLTFVGGYNNLDYFDSSLLNYGSVNARAGYNYVLDRKNTVGADYTFVKYNYSNFAQSITTHTLQLTYGRRVTGRLAFQLAAGPQIILYQTPIVTNSGSGGGSPTGAGSTVAGWSLNANLQYQLKRAQFALSYNHGLSGGSGIQAGTESDTVSGSANRQVSRLLSAGITGGYSRSNGLTVVGTATPFTQTFDYWYGGGNLGYALNRMLTLSVSYQLQYQDSGAGFCIGMTCGTNIVRHTISFGVNWRDRPLLF